ncbi:MAG: signal recognition particle-docking protein FtsY [Caulobacteraceae bacterium]
MTDPSSEKRGWFSRLTQGLARSSKQMADQVVGVLTKVELHEDAIAELEDMLVEADFGPAAASRIANAYSRGRVGLLATRKDVMEGLAAAIAKELEPFQGRFEPLADGRKPYVVLFVGVNGSGKTTTLGKIAADLKARGAKVMIAAGDTFRAAAIEQVKVWGERAGAPVIAREIGADAAGLAYEALERAKAENIDVLLIDTAGRLQNKSALMDELAKVVRVLKKLDPSAPHETLLVLDATVGGNALSQIAAFDRIAGVTGVVMTKLDGTARAAELVPEAEATQAPIKLIGVGEGIDDLQPFDARAFARSLVGLETQG